MGQFIGHVQLNVGFINSAKAVRDPTTGVPKMAVTPPAFRIYGPAGVMGNGTGSLSLKDPSSTGGLITNATNATPIVVTSAGHKLTTGTQVTISGVLGNTAANGDWQVTVIDPNNFSLNGSVGNGVYTQGGIWNVTGLYGLNFSPQGSDGYVQGQTYFILYTWTVGGQVQVDVDSFTVV